MASSKPRIGHFLLVEDDTRVLHAYEMMLDHIGYSSESVASGEEALERIGQRRFDGVILDQTLEGPMSGGDVVAALRAERPELLGRTILATGDLEAAGADQLAKDTGVRLLGKPFGLKELREAVALLSKKP
jgi:DNA-binding NtrC family response regulator